MSFLICVALTAAGLAVSWLRWRRNGVRSGVRFAAWSLLPMAVYLTGVATLIGRIGSALARFGGAFVFSPKTYAGVLLAGLALVMFVVSGGLPAVGRRKGKASKAGPAGSDQDQGTKASPAITKGTGKVAKAPRRAPADDDGLGDVEEILRRRGIT